MDAREAAMTVEQVERLRRETRRRSRGDPQDAWLAMVLFGCLILLTPVIERLFGGPGVGIYWAVAGPMGGFACAWYYRRRELLLGLEMPPVPHVVVSIAIIGGALALGWIGGASGTELAWMGPLLVVSAGYMAFASIDQAPLLRAVALVLAVLVVALATSGLDDETAGVIATVAYGGTLLATGTALWARVGREP